MKLKIILAGILLIGIGFFKCHSSSDKKENPTASGLPGDNLDLFAVMNLLEKSSSPKDFEKLLNEKSNHVNNLDLNGDGRVDYIRVIDNVDENDHAFILRVPLNANESQDVAVIEMEKRGNNKVNMELIGDKDLYGANYIVQPKNEKSQAGFLLADVDILVNVWYWPFVTAVYSPGYVVWVSPYYWDYYPEYWVEWEPLTYEVYYADVEFYHPYYVEVRENYLPHAQQIFYANRVSGNFTYVRNENEKIHRGNKSHGGDRYFDKGSGGIRKNNASKIERQPYPTLREKNHSASPIKKNKEMKPGNKNRGGKNYNAPKSGNQKNVRANKISPAPGNRNKDFVKPAEGNSGGNSGGGRSGKKGG